MVTLQDRLCGKTERVAMHLVEEILTSVEKKCKGIQWSDAMFKNQREPSWTSSIEATVSGEAQKLLETYYRSALQRMMAQYTADMYKKLYQIWKETTQGFCSSWNLVEFSSSLSKDARKALQTEARTLVCSVASRDEWRGLALDQVLFALDKARQLTRTYTRRKVRRIANPSFTNAQRVKIVLRIQRDAKIYARHQIHHQLLAHQVKANTHLAPWSAQLYKKRSG